VSIVQAGSNHDSNLNPVRGVAGQRDADHDRPLTRKGRRAAGRSSLWTGVGPHGLQGIVQCPTRLL